MFIRAWPPGEKTEFAGTQSFLVVLLVLAWLMSCPPAYSASGEGMEPDLELGEEINEVCASCHGEFGQGGSGGEYPRIAGLPQNYLIQQLQLFRKRERINIPMLPYTEERELPDEDLLAVSAYLSRVELPSKMPNLPEETSAYEKLLLARRIINIARFSGDLELGEELYADCVQCHGEKGWGKAGEDYPPLAGQYTEYLAKQIRDFISGKRWHEFSEELFSELDPEEISDLLAYLSILDDE